MAGWIGGGPGVGSDGQDCRTTEPHGREVNVAPNFFLPIVLFRKNLTYDRSCVSMSARPRAGPSLAYIASSTAQQFTCVCVWSALCLQPSDPTCPYVLLCADRFACPHWRENGLFLYEDILKNILSTSYYFLFENWLHQYVLRDETNKTISHLHMFSWCFTLVTTYVMTYSLCSSNLCVYHFAVVTTYVYKEYCFCINSCMWVYDRFY